MDEEQSKLQTIVREAVHPLSTDQSEGGGMEVAGWLVDNRASNHCTLAAFVGINIQDADSQPSSPGMARYHRR